MSRTYETAIKIGATISKAFKSDTYNAASALEKLAKASKQLKEADKAAAAFKKLDDQVTKAKAKYDTATEALRALKDAERAAGGATKESTQWRKAGERAVASAARQLDRATKAADKNREALQKLGVDTSKLTSEQERLTRALAATERQEKALASYEKSRERLFGARSKTPLMQKAGAQIRGVASDAMFLGSAAVGAGGALAALVVHTIKTGDEIGDTADKLGIGATQLQELRYGARQSGAEVGALDIALRKMAATVGKQKTINAKTPGPLAVGGFQMFAFTKSPNAEKNDPFAQLGLNAAKLSKLAPQEQLKKIADAMAKLKTHDDRAAVAQQIFGKGAAEILPFLAEGSKGIERLAKDAHKYGGVLSEEAIKNADLADKAMRDAEMAVGGLVTTLTADLIPVATDVFKTFAGYVADNRAQIKQWASTAAKWITGTGIPAFKNITHEVITFGGKVLWLVNGAAKLTGGFGNLALVVGGLRIAPLALTFGKIGIEATKAAIAVVRYVAAAKAAQAAGGGIPGVNNAVAAATGKLIGLAANAAMVAGAAAIGYAIGSYLDEKYKISDDLAEGAHILTTSADNLTQEQQAAKKSAWSVFKAGFFGGSADIAAAADRARVQAARDAVAPPTGPRSAGGAGVHVAPVIHINEARTRADVSKGMDHAKQQALDAYDKRQAQRKRVSFGE